MADAPKLKPCPSCGSAAKVSVELIKDYARVSAHCTECPMEAWCITVYDDVVESMGFVVKVWNTRADLIDMDVLRRVEAAMYNVWYKHDGRCCEQSDLNELHHSRLALRAIIEKLK